MKSEHLRIHNSFWKSTAPEWKSTFCNAFIPFLRTVWFVPSSHSVPNKLPFLSGCRNSWVEVMQQIAEGFHGCGVWLREKENQGPLGQLGGLLVSGWGGSNPSSVPFSLISPLGKEHSTGRFQFQPVQHLGRLGAENRAIKGSSGQENSYHFINV